MVVKEGQIVRAMDLAKMLGVSDRHIRDLANENVVKKTAQGKYLLLESVRGYIEYLKSRNDADISLKDEKIKEETKRIIKDTEIKELKIKELRNQLHSADVIEKVMTDSLMNMKGKLLSLSNKLAPQIIALDNLGEIQDVIQYGIFEALEELSEYNAEMFRSKNFVDDDEEEEMEVKNEKRKRGRPKKSQ